MLSMSLVGAAVGGSQPNVEDGFVKVEGGEISYNVRGSGCPVVFLGGGSAMDHRQWEEQLAAFRNRFRVIGLDSRGVGRASPPIAPFSFSEDLAAALDSLGIEKAVVVGASFAGGVAIDFAIAHPERVLRVR